MKTFKTIIKEALKEYEDIQISVTTVERTWNDILKDWVDTEVKTYWVLQRYSIPK